MKSQTWIKLTHLIANLEKEHHGLIEYKTQDYCDCNKWLKQRLPNLVKEIVTLIDQNE